MKKEKKVKQHVNCKIHGITSFAEFTLMDKVLLRTCFACLVEKLKECGLKHQKAVE